MKMYSRFGLLFLAGLLCLGVRIGKASAGEVKIRTVVSPLAATVAEDKWNLRNVEVMNTNDTPANVRAIFDTSTPSSTADSGDQGQSLTKTRFYEDLVVAPHSTRRFTMAVKPHGMEGVGVQMKQKKVDEMYKLEDASGRPMGALFLLTGLSRQQDIYLHTDMLNEGADLSYISWWNPETSDFMPSLKERDKLDRLNAQIGVAASQLPDRWYAYDVAHMVVLSGVDMGVLRPAQVDALLNWVRKGGVLIIAGSTGLGDMLQGELGQAAGVSAASVHSVQSLRDVTDVRRGEMLLNDNSTKPVTNYDSRTPLAEAKNQPADRRTVTFQTPLPMVQLVPDDATVFFTANDLPLLTHRALGNGHVLVLAVPTAALQNAPLGRLWRVVSELRARIAPIRNDEGFLAKSSPVDADSGHKSAVVARELQFTQGAQPAGAKTAVQVLNEIAGRPGPVRAVPVGILLALTAGTIVAGLVLRLKRRGELVWVLLVPIAIVAGTVLYFTGATRTQEPYTSFVGLTTGVDDDHAVVQELCSYYAGPGQSDKQFASTDARAIVEPIRLPGSGSLDVTRICVNAPMAVTDVDCRPDLTYGYMMQSVVATGGIEGSLTFGPKGLTGRVTNNLGQDLKDAVLYVNLNDARPKDSVVFAATRGMMFHQNRNAFALSDIARAQGLDVLVDDKPGIGPDVFTGRPMLSPTEKNRPSLLQQVVGLGDNVSGVDPMVVGYVENSLLAPADQKATGWGIVAWPVKIKAPPPGTKVFIPSAFTRLAFMGTTGYDRGQFISRSSGGSMTIMVRLPRVIKALKDPVVHLKLDMDASAFDVSVAGIKDFQPEGKNLQATTLKTFENAGGVCPVDVTDAQKYYNPDFGFIFRMTVAPNANSNKEFGPQWRIRNIDVSIEGTTSD